MGLDGADRLIQDGAVMSTAPTIAPPISLPVSLPILSDADDWRWQLRNRISTTDEIAARLPLTPDEGAGLDAAPALFRVGITPYYVSLIDRGAPDCPVRMQVIPRARELVNAPGELVDPLGEDSHSPAPAIVHKYPDRVLFLALDRCAIYCRHCNRRRLVGRRGAHVARGSRGGARLHPRARRASATC